MSQNGGKELELDGIVDVVGDRHITAKGVTYQVLDVYVVGQGFGTIFLKSGYSPGDVVGLTVGVFNGRLNLIPKYKVASV